MNIYQKRKNIFIFFVVFFALAYWIRLIQIQVFTEKYKEIAKDNVVETRIIVPPRGLIYDRNNKILVSNQAVYDLMVTPNRISNLDTAELCKTLNIDKEKFLELYQSMENAVGYASYKPNFFVKNISQTTYGLLQERMFKFRGFFVQPRSIRKYPNPIAAHIVGYVGEVNDREISASNGYYRQRDHIGKTGLENIYEKVLRGEKGEIHVLVNKFNIEQGSYSNGELDQKSISGKHLLSTIDSELQAFLESLFANKKGGIVAIEPSTGEILAMVSGPTFNPNLLTEGRERSQNYASLSTDPNLPLINRAASSMYPPGSTFKIAMALIGLEEGVITPNTTYMVNGGYFLPGLKIGDHVHGPVNLYTSIVKSSNAYYCHVFRGIIDINKFDNVEDGYNNWRNWILGFGMGQKVGVDIYNETTGILPSTKRYDKIYGEHRWKSSNILSLAIGQAEISLTPLQLANFTSIVANRGYYIPPHLVKSYINGDTITNLNFNKHNFDIDTHYFSLVINAMEDVLKVGTAIRYGSKFGEYQICGKTGTSQNPHGEDHSVFIAFAPKDNPKIAVAAILENAGQGAHWAAPICMLAIEKYLSGTISEKTKYIEELMLEGDFISPKKPKPLKIKEELDTNGN